MLKSVTMVVTVAMMLLLSSSAGAIERSGPGYRSGASALLIDKSHDDGYETMQARTPRLDIVDAPSIEQKTWHFCPCCRDNPNRAASHGRDIEGHDYRGSA